MANTALGVILQLLATLWIIGLGISFIGKHQDQYLTWSRTTVSGLWRTQWKLLVGIAIGWALSYPGTIHLLVQ